MTAAEERPDSATDVPVWRVGPPRPRQPDLSGEPRDTVIREGLVELVLNGRTLVRASCLPAALDDFALGFLAGEGLIDGPQAVWSVAVPPDAAKVEVRASVDPDRLALFLERLATSSGCGGGASAVAAALSVCASDACFRPEDISERMKEFEHASTLFRETGGVHAAAVTDGRTLEAFAEDIGRHNAVDKIVGWASEHGRLPLTGHLLMVSGRVSFEIAQKALAARIPVVAAVSAPSSLAIELAESAGLTIIAFLRGDRFNVYGARQRVFVSPASDAKRDQ